MQPVLPTPALTTPALTTPAPPTPALPDRRFAARRILRFLRGTAYSRSIRSLSSRLKRYDVLKRWEPSADFKVMAERSRRKWFIRDIRRFVTTSVFMITRKVIRSGSAIAKEEDVPAFNIRVLLASHLIVNRPESCFEAIGELERRVQASSSPVFDSLCALIDRAQGQTLSSMPWLQHRDFLRQVKAYLEDFQAWKVPDQNKLFDRIKHALLALYRAENHLTEQSQEYESMKQEFRAQKAKLRAKMVQIAGTQGLAKVDELLRKERIYPEEEEAGASEQPAASSLPPSTNASGLSSLPGRMTNEQLAHELLLDPTFKLDNEGAGYIDNTVLSGVRESFKVAFWNSLVDDLRISPPCYTRVIRVLGEVREALIDLKPSLGAQLREKIDTTYFTQLVEMGSIDWPACVAILDGVISTLIGMQEPQRRQETESKWEEMKRRMQSCTTEQQPEAFCKSLEYVLARVNATRVDEANRRLRSIAHIIQQHGVEYEHNIMAKRIRQNPEYLQHTPEWILRSITKLSKENGMIIPDILRGDGATFQTVHAAAILGLVTADVPFTEHGCPETLLLDVSRFKKLQRCFRFDLYACGCLRMASQKILSKDRGTAALGLIRHLSTALNAFDASEMDTDGAKKVFRDSFKSELSDEEKGIITSTFYPFSDVALGQLLEVPAPTSAAVFPFVEEHWYKVAVKASESQPAYINTWTLNERITRNAKALRKIIDVNRNVHTKLYNRIIAEQAAKVGKAS